MKTTDALDKIRDATAALAEEIATWASPSSEAQLRMANHVGDINATLNAAWPLWEKVDLFQMPLAEVKDYLALLEREGKLVAFLRERHPKYVDEKGHPYSITLASDLGFFGKAGSNDEDEA